MTTPTRLRKTIAGRFRLLSKLGEGGMGTAYRAWDSDEGVPVVIKMPRVHLVGNAQFIKRFSREVRVMAAVPHPHIVPIVDYGDDAGGEFAGVPYVAMRFLPGGSLADRRLRDASRKPMPNHPASLHLWLPGVASALDAVHAAGIVHRDVKPANIFFDGFWHSYLGDFGIAKTVQDVSGETAGDEQLTATHIGLGTPAYMAPEQFLSKAEFDGRADQYALAVMVYEMLCGSLPFTGTTTNFAVEHSTLQPPPLGDRQPGLPPRLCSAVHWALSKNPADRFATCRDFVATVLANVKPMALEQDVMRLLCPSCSNILKLPLTAGGSTGKCPRCQKVMNVAQDLGSLSLEGEEHEASEYETQGRPDSKPIPTLMPVSGPTPVSKDDRRWKWPRVDPVVLGVGLVAWASFLAVSYLLTHNVTKPVEQTAEFLQLMEEKQKVEAEKLSLQEENQRLTAELAAARDVIARTNAASLPLEPQATEAGQKADGPPPTP